MWLRCLIPVSLFIFVISKRINGSIANRHGSLYGDPSCRSDDSPTVRDAAKKADPAYLRWGLRGLAVGGRHDDSITYSSNGGIGPRRVQQELLPRVSSATAVLAAPFAIGRDDRVGAGGAKLPGSHGKRGARPARRDRP